MDEGEELTIAVESEEEAALRRFKNRTRMWDEKRHYKELAQGVRVTLKDIEYALRKFRGNLYYTATFLGMERRTLKAKIDSAPNLEYLRKELLEEKLDIAEYKLFEQVEDGVLPAITLVLRTLGKERGYSEKSTVEHEVGPRLQSSAASLIEAMRNGGTLVEEEAWVEPKLLESHEATK
jgi:ribosomal protein S21